MINAIFHESRRTYGSPRVRIELQRLGERCGKNRIAKLMGIEGLRARQKRRFRPKTTQRVRTRFPSPTTGSRRSHHRIGPISSGKVTSLISRPLRAGCSLP